VIKKVVEEEKAEIKETLRRLKQIKPYLFSQEKDETAAASKGGNLKQDLSEEDEDDDNVVVNERKNKAVSRLNKLKRTERNKILQKRSRR